MPKKATKTVKPAVKAPVKTASKKAVGPFTRAAKWLVATFMMPINAWLRGLINIFALAGVNFVVSSIAIRSCIAQYGFAENSWCADYINTNVIVLSVIFTVLWAFIVMLFIRMAVKYLIKAYK
ncbi:MAG: hypothetical protein FWD15_05630 [Alphaproteobacteria bacterium]|nr:hypothetical protein [Alphaproteobacteria bacterium]